MKFKKEEERASVEFSSKGGKKDPARRKRLKKRILVGVFLVLFGLGAYFGARAYNSIRDVFSGDAGILNLLGGSQGQLLKGELDGRVNVLILGIGDEEHDGALLSDTIMVASYDTKTKTVAMISIPRDFYTQIPGFGYAKINAAHSHGEQQKEGGGPKLAKEAVENVSGLPIHYFARLDFTGLEEAVDVLGGITIDVERSFCDYKYTRSAAYNPVCFDEGLQVMDGETALKYSRSRKAAGPEGSDFARAKRQQNVLVALKEKALSAETAFNPSRVLKILDTLGKHLKTNFGMDEIARLYELSRGLDREIIIQETLDPETGLVTDDSSTAAGYILFPVEGQGNYMAISDFFKNVFSGVGIRKENAKVALLNGTWSTFYYTNLHESMERKGYNIVKEGGAETRNYLTSQIIDYTGGRNPETVGALEEELGVKATTAESNQNQEYEIKVILGSDYRG